MTDFIHGPAQPPPPGTMVKEATPASPAVVTILHSAPAANEPPEAPNPRPGGTAIGANTGPRWEHAAYQ